MSALTGMVFFLAIFVGLGLHAALVVWTLIDAVDHTEDQSELWGLIVFLAPVFGLVAYVVFARDTTLADGQV